MRPKGGTTLPDIPRALSIAGSDSGGGAGVQADLKTFSALGVYGMTAITAVTVQNTQGVSGYQEIDPDTVASQVAAVLDDIGAGAVKTGMLASTGIIRAIAGALRGATIPNLVVDPVFVSKHGHALLREDAVDALKDELLPLATLVTPNTHEAAGLAGFEVDSRGDMVRAAEVILDFGCEAVLMKGGHLEGDVAADLLFHDGIHEWLEAPRIDTKNTHGTGCTLSAAITAYLARGEDLASAVRSGKTFVTEAIRHSLTLGKGIGPVNPLWKTLPSGS